MSEKHNIAAGKKLRDKFKKTDEHVEAIASSYNFFIGGNLYETITTLKLIKKPSEFMEEFLDFLEQHWQHPEAVTLFKQYLNLNHRYFLARIVAASVLEDAAKLATAKGSDCATDVRAVLIPLFREQMITMKNDVITLLEKKEVKTEVAKLVVQYTFLYPSRFADAIKLNKK